MEFESRIRHLLPDLERVSTDIHAHPRIVGAEAAAPGAPKATGRVSELPTNHNPRFAPVLHPTIETGVATLVVASRAWLTS